MEDFRNLVITVVGSTGLEIRGGQFEIAFLEYLMTLRRELLKFEAEARLVYDEWRHEGGSFKAETDFFINYGVPLFEYWLTKVYPFNKENLTVAIGRHSAVDSNYKIKYEFKKNEYMTIKSVLQSLDLTDTESDVEKAATLLLINAVKSISRTFSSLIELDYKIYTSDSNVVVDGYSIAVDYEAAGRIKK